MAQAIVGLEEAAELIGRLKAAAEGNGRFPEVVMPNGKRLADCTFGYIGQLEEAMQVMGLQMPEPAAPHDWVTDLSERERTSTSGAWHNCLAPRPEPNAA
jgi:hypothetical protein